MIACTAEDEKLYANGRAEAEGDWETALSAPGLKEQYCTLLGTNTLAAVTGQITSLLPRTGLAQMFRVGYGDVIEQKLKGLNC